MKLEVEEEKVKIKGILEDKIAENRKMKESILSLHDTN